MIEFDTKQEMYSELEEAAQAEIEASDRFLNHFGWKFVPIGFRWLWTKECDGRFYAVESHVAISIELSQPERD